MRRRKEGRAMSSPERARLRHVGLSIRGRAEIDDFYVDVLGLEKAREFDLPDEYAREIFRRQEGPPVAQLSGQGADLELFLGGKGPEKGSFAHVCLSFPDRGKVLARAEKKGYEVTIIPRQGKADLAFIADRSGNKFEIMEE